MRLIQKFIIVLDYIFYLTAKAYYRWDKKDAVTAVFVIAIFLCSLIILPAILFTRIYFGKSFLIENESTAKSISIIIALIILIISFFRYRKRFDILNEKYKNENIRSKKIRGVLVICILLLPWLIFFII